MSKSPTTRLGLDNIVQRKGEATRPADIPQRGEPAQPAAPATNVHAEDQKDLKALTYRIAAKNWRVLRDYAHQRETSHQQIIDEALRRYCRDEGIVLPVPPRATKTS